MRDYGIYGNDKERKEMILSLMNEPSYVPMKIKELAILLEVPKERREELKEVLDALLEEGRIRVSKKGKYAKPEILAQKGVFTAHPRGFGFVSIEGREGDVFENMFSPNGSGYWGTALKYVYNTRFGPLSLDCHWSDYNKKVGLYFSIGHYF